MSPFLIFVGLFGAGGIAGGLSGGGDKKISLPTLDPQTPKSDPPPVIPVDPPVMDMDDDDDDDDRPAIPGMDMGDRSEDLPGGGASDPVMDMDMDMDDEDEAEDDDEDDDDDMPSMPGMGSGHGGHGGDAPGPVMDMDDEDEDDGDDDRAAMPGMDMGGGHGDHADHGGHGGHEGHGGHGHDDHSGHGSPTIPVPAPTASQAEFNAFVAAVRALPEAHPHNHDAAMMDEHMAAMDLAPRDEATHIAVRAGDWFDPSTWHNGSIPGDDARVLIPDGVTVEYDEISNDRLFTVRVDGKLDFGTGTDSRMILDTMIVSPTGILEIGTASDPVAPDVSVELIIANNGPIDTDWDPMLLSRGIISHGKATIHGAAKDAHEKVLLDPMAGDTSITFETLPEGWQIGDEIVIAGTSYEGHKWDNTIKAARPYESEDEIRIITGIEGNTILFDDALIHDHDTPRADLKTSVANLTRNVIVETENPDTAEIFERGHVMFMHSDDVDVRYAEFAELGRTDKSQDSLQSSDFDPISYDSNVQGRYSLHLHRTGVENLDDPAMVVGNSVHGSPGWGYVHHDSNAILENNASFDTFGAGYVAETGNETGAWIDNIAIYAEGIDWGTPKNTSELSATMFDTGRGGDGFWFQGRLVESADNVAASVNTGYVYFHRDGDSRMIKVDAEQFEYPDALFGDDDVSVGDIPILEFSGNETFASKSGLHVVKSQPNQGHDVWSHFDDFTAWNVVTGASFEYTSHYILSDFDLIAKEPSAFSDPKNGINFGKNISEMVILDSSVSGFETGISLQKKWVTEKFEGDPHDYVLIDTEITDVGTEYAYYDPKVDRILSADDLPDLDPDLNLDEILYTGKLISNSRHVEITGTKEDTLGVVNFPGGSDSFRINEEDVISALETDGYWTTTDGKSYYLEDIYFTDRATGDIYYETHPVYLADGVASRLGKPSWEFRDAVDHGVQDIVETGGKRYAGDQLLDTALPAIPRSEEPPASSMLEAMMSDDAGRHDHGMMSMEDDDEVLIAV